MTDEHKLTQWVIYFGATNHPPGTWVVRAWDILPGKLVPHALMHECRSLFEARCKVPEGLFRLNRQPDDDPCIVEVWI